MNRKLLATSIGAVLAMSAWASAHAQTTKTDEEKKKDDATTIGTVVVTGSLIPQAQKEGASPVTTITSEDIQRQGFRNVSDVLRAQPLATGTVQDNQFSGGFTPGATTISLLGLSPGFTLVLIDGRPLADYPLLYNGQSNFTDLSSIPTGMVDRIDILPGNQSAIYGSSAIAGVVNIILKKDLTGVQLNARIGGYSEGGGRNERLQVTGGTELGKLNVTYGFQYSHQDPIWAYQRDFADSTNDNPNAAARFGSRTFLILDGFTGQYYDPGAATCARLSGNFGGSTIYDNRPGSGNFCGSREQVGYTTLLNEESGINGYLSTRMQINESSEFYASLLYGVNKTDTNSGSRFWSPDINGSGGYIFDANTGGLDLYQHIFSPEETGLEINNGQTRSKSYSFAAGFRGGVGESNWDYDVYYARSQYNLTDKQIWPLAGKIEDFFRGQFLGPQLGTYYGYAVYQPNQALFYQSLTPAQYASFQGNIRSESTTWTHNLTAVLTNTELFPLPAGPVGVAVLLTAGHQVWNNPTDPRVINGDFWGLTGTQGAGKRENAGVAVEFRIPVFNKLTANLSTRLDKYTNINAGSDRDLTYKFGLEYRPMESLLIRGNYATAFRAPDMSYIYAGESGFFTSVVDYYRCAQNDPGPLEDCLYNGFQVQGSRTGNKDLESITAKSFGYGVVWSPSANFDIRADYYSVDIDNEVSDLSINKLLFDENQCRSGVLDINSPTCVDALARISRNPGSAGFQPNALRSVRINPINISRERVSGVLASTTYRWDIGRAGKLTFSADWNMTRKHEYQQYPGDPALDLINDPTQSSEFRNITSGQIDWDVGKWSATLFGTRYGPTPTYAAQNAITAGARTVGPYTLYNMSVKYNLTSNSGLGLTVNNVRNSRPPVDTTYVAYPYYNIFNYNGYGRALWLEYNIDFGSND